MDSINPSNNTVIGRVTLADEEDAKRSDQNRERFPIRPSCLHKRERSPTGTPGGFTDTCWTRSNHGMLDDPRAPWGGFKFSGVGREFGASGIEAFLEPRAILE